MSEEIKVIVPEPEQIKITVGDNEEAIKVTVQDGEILKVVIAEGLGHGTVSSIADHRNVGLTDLADKENLVYDIILGKWVNRKILAYDSDYNCFIVE